MPCLPVLLALVAGGAGLVARAEPPRFAPAFGDHMVLQRGVSAPVWGVAEPGAQVVVTFAGRTAGARAGADGRWLARLDPLPASSNGSVLAVRDGRGGGQQVTDVLVGDVWLCSGQSNMRWQVAQSEGAAELTASAAIPGLRLLDLQCPAARPAGLDPAGYFHGAWACSSPEQARGFSAVAFVFGRELHRHSGVPVGLILNAVGGAPMVAWLPEPVVRSRPEYAPPAGEPWFMAPVLIGWVRAAIRGDLKVPADVPAGVEWPSHPYQPSYLHRAGIAPLQPMALRGVVWYQGESDAEHADPALPTLLLEDLVRSWREGFQSPRLPFLMVQLPRINSPERVHWPVFREVQRRAARTIPGVHLAATIDLGVFGANVHPPRKTPVGERLALIARAEVNGERVAALAPDFAAARPEPGAIRIAFDHSDGLRSSDGQPLRGFELAGADGVFHPAGATLGGRTVRVAAAPVARPATVRYGWHMDADLNLVNSAGLPACPFSSAKCATDAIVP